MSENSLLENIESLTRASVNTDAGMSDSGGLSHVADALRMLTWHNQFRIIKDDGQRFVVGYWPENDPNISSQGRL